jgi:DNA-binding phage protein
MQIHRSQSSMKNLFSFIVVFTIIFLSGCNTSLPWLQNRVVDKVYVVSVDKGVKRFRGYFRRDSLYRFDDGKRTRFLYHPKRHEAALLLHRKDGYYLYPFRLKHAKPVRYGNARTSLSEAMRKFASYGYRHMVQPEANNFIITTGLRRYKGYKTVMVELADYHNLHQHYLDALKRKDFATLMRLPDIPSQLIRETLVRTYRSETDPTLRKRLEKVADKLGIKLPLSQKNDPKKLFDYYLRHASSEELRQYLNTTRTNGELDTVSRRALQQRLHQLEYERLLKEGNLDRLIEAYRKYKDPRLKARIMELMNQKKL